MQTASDQAQTTKPARAKPAKFPSKAIPLTERASYSPGEWCALNGIGRTTLYKMWKNGAGPEFVMIGSRRRIPRDAKMQGGAA